ncbi:hypothetical protein [Nocardia alni]|uniref:hypothetical protein n=1 Tax=Nocardia alni TaxID=2815723 RepID=UPI001C21186E|nr:hypothetical protein [Nocardia alni]
MVSPALASRGRGPRQGRYALVGGLAALALCLVGCDSHVGIEGTDFSTDDPGPPASSVTSAAPAPLLPPPGPGELEVTVSLAARDPKAADAITRWAMDLQHLSPERLEKACWTMAPQNVESMYASKQPILDALARPGVDDGSAITWRGQGPAAVTVVAQRVDIDSGYACPRVYAAGTAAGFDSADARHTVRRYLDRATGAPLDPADKESTHPLLCPASPPSWDPTGSGEAVAAPLASDPGKLSGVMSFIDQSITSRASRGGYIGVSVPVLTASGEQQNLTFTLKSTRRGYCIGEVSS